MVGGGEISKSSDARPPTFTELIMPSQTQIAGEDEVAALAEFGVALGSSAHTTTWFTTVSLRHASPCPRRGRRGRKWALPTL